MQSDNQNLTPSHLKHNSTLDETLTNSEVANLINNIKEESFQKFTPQDKNQENNDAYKWLYEGIRKELNCQVCYEVYKNPVRLPCDHSFCKECVRKTMTIQKNTQTSARCPLCNFNYNHRTLQVDRRYKPISDLVNSFRAITNNYTQLPIQANLQKRRAKTCQREENKDIVNEEEKGDIVNNQTTNQKQATLKQAKQNQNKSVSINTQRSNEEEEVKQQQSQNNKKGSNKNKEEVIEKSNQKRKGRQCQSRVEKSRNDIKKQSSKKRNKTQSSIKQQTTKKRKQEEAKLPSNNKPNIKRRKASQTVAVRSQVSTPPIYIYTSMLPGKYSNKLEKLTQQHKYLKIQNDKEIDVLSKDKKVLIIQHHQHPENTLKVVQAIAFQLPIISFQWVLDCLDQKQAQYNRETIANLFKNFSFQFQKRRQLLNCPLSISQLQQIVKKCGGYFCNGSQQDLTQKFTKVSYDKNFSKDRRQPEQIEVQKQGDQLYLSDKYTIDIRWITESIIHQQLQPMELFIISK